MASRFKTRPSPENKKKNESTRGKTREAPSKKGSTGAPAGLPAFLQPKLRVGAIDDPLEREADRVAEQVTSSGSPGIATSHAAPGIQRKCACGGSSGECEECRKRDAELSPAPVIHRRANGNDGHSTASEAPPVVDAALRAPGQPLDGAIRQPMESRFGRDFSDVRVHTSSAAAESANAIDALAYTAGEHVVFGEGQYQPESSAGQKLLAHELTHVVQQNGSSSIHRQPAGTKEQQAAPGKTIDWHPGMYARVVKETLGYKGHGVETYKVGEVLQITSEPTLMGSRVEVQVTPAELPGRAKETYLGRIDVENLVPTAAPEEAKSSGTWLSAGTDLRKMSVSPSWARGLSDYQLGMAETMLRANLSGPAPDTAGADYLSIQQNLQVLLDEQKKRATGAGFDFQPPPMVQRPTGLPLDEGYNLQELTGVSSDVAAQLPEGQIVVLSQDALEGKTLAADRAPAFLPGLGGGSWTGLRSADTALMNFGLAPAGDYAIGLVAIPPAAPNPLGRYFNLTLLENPLEAAGHTAVYVRQGGQIIMVRGYNPKMSFGEPSTIFDVMKDYGKIFTGKMGVPGDITNDVGMFRMTSVRTIEYPVTPEVAAEFMAQLPPLGTPAPGEPPLYTAPPSTYASVFDQPVGCVGTNCGLWATQKVEGALGARVGVAGQEPIVDIPVPGQAAQGKLYGMMDPRSNVPLVDMPGATGGGVRGGIGNGLRVIKWGGRLFIVASAVKFGYDVWTAPEGERGHVAFVEGGGIVGGFLGGAALGLFCGPGAPVCCVVTGIVGGIAGGMGGGALAEAIWNFPETARTANEILEDLEEQRIQQLVRKSGGTMPPAVQDAMRRAGPAIFFAH